MPRQRDPLNEYRLIYVIRGPEKGRYGIRYHATKVILFQDDEHIHQYTVLLEADMIFLTGDTDLFDLAKTIHAHMQEATHATTSTAV